MLLSLPLAFPFVSPLGQASSQVHPQHDPGPRSCSSSDPSSTHFLFPFIPAVGRATGLPPPSEGQPLGLSL